MGEILNKYNKLKDLIAKRQLFESQVENQKPPYRNHRTDYNFCDVDGYTLLHYASMLGDVALMSELLDAGVEIEMKPIFLKNGTTALQMALEAGHLDAAKILFKQGAVCNQIAAAVVHSSCRLWFNQEMIKSLQQSYPEFPQGIFNKSQDSRFFCDFSDSPLQRISELGYVELIQLAYENKAPSYLASKNNMMINAASNGHKNIVAFLLSQGELLNPQHFQLEQTPLHAAAEHQQHEMVSYLIANGAYINYQNKKKQTSLMLAVESNDFEMVKLFIDNNANIMLQDVYGDSVFHYAIQQENLDILKLLVSHTDVKQILNCKNIYGLTAIDVALTSGREEQLALLCDDEMLKLAKQSPRYAQHMPAINHRKLLPKMHYFLKINYRDTDYLQLTGHCNGFVFLRNFYNSKNMKKYYYDTLRIISSWNGDLEEQYKKFPEEYPQTKYHENLFSLLEQWTNDVIWFQGTSTNEVIGINQDQMVRKFEFANPYLDKNNSIVMIYQHDAFGKKMSRDQLIELLLLLKKMPNGIQLNIGGGQHSVSGDIVGENNCIIDYHDPNFKYEINPTISTTWLANIIVDVKYRAIGQMSDEDNMFASFRIYYFNHNAKDINFAKFELFAHDELPHSESMAKCYQEKSPCKFTPLHAAIFTGSLISLKHLLQQAHCDITAKNAFGQTAFDMALESGNTDMLALLLQFASDKFDIGMALENFCPSKDGLESNFFKILLNYAQPAHLISLCIKAIANGNLTYVEHFVKNNRKMINTPSSTGKTLLFEALKINNFYLVDLLLKNDASVLVLSSNDNPFNENLLPALPLEYVITNAMTQYLALIFHHDSNKLLPLLSAHINNQTKIEIELLNTISFDLTNPLHKNLLSMLLRSALKLKNAALFIELTKHCDAAILNQTIDGKPLIIHAMIERNLLMMEALLKQGASVDSVTESGGNTALHLALKIGLDIKFIQLLVDHHASVTIINKEGVDARQLVANISDNDITALIIPNQYRPSMF